MNRRNFLGSLIGGVAATAAVRTWPFRVYSFSSEIALPSIYGIQACQMNENIGAFHGLARFPFPMLKRQLKPCSPFYVCDGELGRGSVTLWKRVDNVEDFKSAIREGYRMSDTDLKVFSLHRSARGLTS